MKVIKNTAFRVVLYIIGFIAAVLLITSAFASSFRYGHFSEEEDFDGPFETSVSIKDSIYNDLSNLQSKAAVEKKLYYMDFADNELKIYDYSAMIDTIEGQSDYKKTEKTTVGDLLGTKNGITKLSAYVDEDGGSDTVYAAYPNMPQSANNSFIRMTWGDYNDIVRDRCIKYSYKYDNLYNYNDDSEAHDVDEYEKSQYNKLLEDYPEMGIQDGNYFTYINDYLYMYDVNNSLLYYGKFGYAQTLSDLNMNQSIYFPYKDADDFKDISEFEEYILSSYIYRSDIELAYSTLSDYQKSQIKQNTDYYNYYYGCNTAFSIDGEKVNHAWIYDTTGLQNVNKSPEDGYNVSYPDLCELYKNHSDIYVSYNAKTGNVEQWYKNDKGEIVPFEYLDAEKLKSLTGVCNENFVLAINLTSYASSRVGDNLVYSFTGIYDNPLWVFGVSFVIFIAAVVLLIMGEPRRLYLVDKAPYIVWAGVYSVVLLLMSGLIVGIAYNSYDLVQFINKEKLTVIIFCIVFLLLAYIFTAAVIMNVVRRIKCHAFLGGFVTVWLVKEAKKFLDKNGDRISGRKKTVIFMLFFIIVNILGLAVLSDNPYYDSSVLVALFLIVLDVFVGIVVFKYLTDVEKILKVSRQIEAGELNAKVNTQELKFNARELGESLNSLGDGLSKAVDSSIRDERTKAELITNVSHDIKTPLTSIINYVDLLKKEEINNEKATEYINVLDQKSQRLKQLILDLIEASKTSTGNIELECMNLNLVELLNQGLGEYEDKLAEASLELVKSFRTDSAVIYADGRRVFRIIDNILNNTVKYAQPGTRVFVDMMVDNSVNPSGNVVLSVKNVSREMLNITAEELTERFVRGDRSRNTEGSGLGLSIAKNLTELQGGSFDITIDGDFFKVDISFPIVNTDNNS